MLQFLSNSMKSHWRRTLSMLLVLLTLLGMLPSTAFASDSVPTFAATGGFEVNIAGATGWNATSLPLPVYDSETDGKQITTVPAAEEAAPIAFVLLEDNGGDRGEIGLVCDDNGNLTSWEGGKVTKTGWVDKESIFVNLPDVLPGIVYTSLPAEQYSSRLYRYEYIVPCLYLLAEQLAEVQKDTMANGETLVVYGAGDQTADIRLAKGDPAELRTYEIDGTAYQKYEAWTDNGLPHELTEWIEPFSISSNSSDITSAVLAVGENEGDYRCSGGRVRADGHQR